MGKPLRLVTTKDVAHDQIMGEVKSLIARMESDKAVAFAVSYAHRDGTTTTAWFHPEGAGAVHQLNSATAVLSNRITNWATGS